MSRLTVAVIFGGQSSEHIVSCMSAANVIDRIDQSRYRLLLIGITQEGHWIKTDSVEDIRSGAWKEGKTSAVISPDATEKSVLLITGDRMERMKIDAAFPVLHGLYGEDGTIQGLLELARIPYVGCGVLASAVSMDKLHTKIIADSLGVCQAAYEPVLKEQLEQMDQVAERVEGHLGYPLFIKPANAGSSRGVSKAKNREELVKGLLEAAKHDRKMLVEESVAGREIECAVFGGGKMPAAASGVGEILAAADFYDFDSKYFNEESRTVTDPQLPLEVVETVRRTALAVFRAVDGYGLARVDFFVRDNGQVVFNEINTMPGFTAISMYPMLWEARGISKEMLVNRLLDHALLRFQYNVS